MMYENDNEVEELFKKFEDRTLPKSEWTHAAHLTVGLCYCFHHPFEKANSLMREGIHLLNDAQGTPNTDSGGYHETLTVFWLKKVSEFLESHHGEKSLSVLASILVASYNDAKLPLESYSRDLLFSVTARRNYVDPDLTKFSAKSATPALAV